MIFLDVGMLTAEYTITKLLIRKILEKVLQNLDGLIQERLKKSENLKKIWTLRLALK